MREWLITDRGDGLRFWRSEDAEVVFKTFADDSLARQIGDPPVDIDAAEAWIADRARERTSGCAYSWAVVRDDVLLGSVTVSSIDRHHRLGWVSYWTCAHARGGGVASSALRAMADWAFADLELFRLELGHRTNNPASCRVAIAAGFVVEGLERAKLRYGTERFDVELHARLATDPDPST